MRCEFGCHPCGFLRSFLLFYGVRSCRRCCCCLPYAEESITVYILDLLDRCLLMGDDGDRGGENSSPVGAIVLNHCCLDPHPTLQVRRRSPLEGLEDSEKQQPMVINDESLPETKSQKCQNSPLHESQQTVGRLHSAGTAQRLVSFRRCSGERTVTKSKYHRIYN